MQSSLPIPPTPVDTIANDVISLPKSTTLLLHPNRPYVHNYWLLNDRLRLKNKKLSRRQQSSCRIAFYSLKFVQKSYDYINSFKITLF
ncbi:unnamed protein product [Adineta steineri]|uniref:Uncharacterized protein n=1 Tax=Adineta steineri TaxID=433720 RepID=A0A815F9S0_9BILA|nr:unnamed protein product [Adineta steineri]CAF3561111.1 unnamed protein product [Adineta steineri]